MGAAQPLEPLVTSLLGDTQELSVRVDRLLRAEAPRDSRKSWTAGAFALATLVVLAAAQPATLRTMHYLIERLIH